MARKLRHPQKVRIVARLRRETTMTLQWIADRLQKVAAMHVAALLRRFERKSQNNEKTFF